MCGSKCLEIVNDGAMPGRPDFNTEEELFKFLRLDTLLRMSVDVIWQSLDVVSHFENEYLIHIYYI